MTTPQIGVSKETESAVERPVRRTYSVREAAAILGVGAPTLYRAIERREVPFVQIGKRLVMPKTWVDGQVEKTS